MEAKRNMAQPRVIIFTTSHCPWCKATKQFLKEKGIRFYEVDVEKNPKAADDLVKTTGQMGVPVTLINNRPVVGFNKPLLEKLLNQYKEV
ncbi:MAG: glutaredoxin family protein [bacterium]